MITRWRLYILAVFLLVIAACILFLRLLNKSSFRVSTTRGIFFTVGVLLCAETMIMLGLSNFNLGVILPALLGLPLVLLSLFWPFLDRGFLLFLRRFSVICYIAASVFFSICGALMLSSTDRSADAKGLIVLGAAVHGDKVTWVLENRLNAAMDYMREHPDCVCVVSGGQGNGESVSEGSAMRKYMLEKGMDENRVFAEEKASNTSENFLFSKAILDDVIGPDGSIAFVTTDFHLFRAGKVAAKLGISAVGIPAKDVWYLKLNNFLRESVAICIYALQGKI